MNRNTESHFAELPTVNIGRSKFNRSFTNKTTFNTGELVPIYVDMDIVPGDTVTMRQSEVLRMATPIAPVMDNCYADFYWFFVPNRLVMDEWQELMGENKDAPWTQTKDIQIPQLIISNKHEDVSSEELDNVVEHGSVLDFMGIPPQIRDWVKAGTEKDDETVEPEREIQISALPTRAYCLTWSEFFRDENLQNPINIHTDSVNRYVLNDNNEDYDTDPQAFITQYEELGGLRPLKVCKPHDYFTSALPQAQKGPAVALPLSEDILPVITTNGWKFSGSPDTKYYPIDDYSTNNLGWYTNGDYGVDHKNTLVTYKTDDDGNIKTTDVGDVDLTNIAPLTAVGAIANMAVDLTKATGATVTALRQAFAIQKFYERDARGGTRYIESIKSHFGVTNPDFRFQRPEYLGGFRHNINMNQIVQSAPIENNGTPLGTTGAYSVTSGEHSDVFTHSFTEHGILLGLMCIRTDHTYQQGINRSWFKKKRLDFYSPEFANLSEQYITNKEIYADGTDKDNEAFGYQECWAEMRYMPDLVSNEMRSNYPQSLDIWHYADDYDKCPKLGDKWIQETDENMKRTLAVQTHSQFIADFYFGAIYTRPLPLYSIPGLIDHH